MANFPTSLPSITNPTANDTLAAVPHHTQHSTANDEIAAIATKVGTGASTPTIHKLLIGSGTGTSAWGSVIGSGSDDYSSAPPRLLNVLDGTYAAPITTLGPTVRISRHEAVPSSVQANPADNSQNAALHVFSHGTINDEVQATGIFSFAHGGSDTPGADLLGVGGLARAINPGATSVAGGGYFEGRRDVDTALSTYGIECRSINYTATDSTYSSSTYSPVMGLWVTSSGTAKIGAHIAVRALDAAAIALTGIGFVAGSVADSTVRDDSSATVSLDVRGTHTTGLDLSNATLTNAIKTPTAGGSVLVGVSSAAANGALLQAKDGITFPASPAGKSNVNTLDFYEEGSFTPALTFATPGDLAVTYSQQNGRYVRIGNRVFFSCDILTSAFTYTTASGSLYVTGLPYTSLTNGGYPPGGGSVAMAGFTLASTASLMARVLSNDTRIYIAAARTGNTVVTLGTGQVASGGTVNLSIVGHYEVPT